MFNNCSNILRMFNDNFYLTLNDLWAVSYTHLDVYKRQKLYTLEQLEIYKHTKKTQKRYPKRLSLIHI